MAISDGQWGYRVMVVVDPDGNEFVFSVSGRAGTGGTVRRMNAKISVTIGSIIGACALHFALGACHGNGNAEAAPSDCATWTIAYYNVRSRRARRRHRDAAGESDPRPAEHAGRLGADLGRVRRRVEQRPRCASSSRSASASDSSDYGCQGVFAGSVAQTPSGRHAHGAQQLLRRRVGRQILVRT